MDRADGLVDYVRLAYRRVPINLSGNLATQREDIYHNHGKATIWRKKKKEIKNA